MALKAYKHLTDGEVKLVEADSAEEAGLVADVVHGASYIQLQNDGSREEVAAAQGDALWEDVTDELGGGSAFVHLTEDTGAVVVTPDIGDPFATTYFSMGTSGTAEAKVATVADPGYIVELPGEAHVRVEIKPDGVHIGDGVAMPDTHLLRTAEGVLELNGAPLSALAHLTEGPGSVTADVAVFAPVFSADGGSGLSAASGLYLEGAAGAGDPDIHIVELWADAGNGNEPNFALGTDGTHWVGDGTAALVSGVLVQSPDTLTTKVIGIDNSGAVVATDL